MTDQSGDDHEEMAVTAVEDRLRERFHDLDPAVVEAAVQVSYAELTGPIRDFVPLLVERKARERLASLQGCSAEHDPREDLRPHQVQVKKP